MRSSWTDDLDRDAYRAWWEAEGRLDLSVCPCGEAAEAIDPIPAGPGLCPRHRFDLTGGSRVHFAMAILDGSYSEAAPATDDELRRARLVADGFLRGEHGPN